MFLQGIEYEQLNRNISFQHSPIRNSSSQEIIGVEFHSVNISLRMFEVSLLLIYDRSIIKFSQRFRSLGGRTQKFGTEHDYLLNQFLVLRFAFSLYIQ